MSDFETIKEILNRPAKNNESTIANELVNEFWETTKILENWLGNPFKDYIVNYVTQGNGVVSDGYYKVFKFTRYVPVSPLSSLDLVERVTYVKVSGWTSSYDGFYTESITEVEPVEKTITVIEYKEV